ncbi:alpha/beta fold hydrolase [Mesorhizobium sp.]|uniref:alpha/beta fold hydrolase n=1 Tax=Mesorhizobium sp. TaxID=1871066 RepID=UPI00338D6593
MLLSILSWLLAVLLLLAVLAIGCLVLATLWIAAKAERLVPPVGKFIEIDGNRIHYVDVGDGQPIVFLHGLGAQLHHFRHTLFAHFGPGYRLIALDRPGSGYSVQARGATGRLPEQAELVRRFIETLGLEKPLVVGHSLGGAITLTLAVEHPEAISGIALLAPLTHMQAGMREKSGLLNIPSPLRRWIMAYTVAIPTSLRYARPTMEFILAPQAFPADYMVDGGGWLGCGQPISRQHPPMSWPSNAISAASNSAMVRSPCPPASFSEPPMASSTSASMASRCKARSKGSTSNPSTASATCPNSSNRNGSRPSSNAWPLTHFVMQLHRRFTRNSRNHSADDRFAECRTQGDKDETERSNVQETSRSVRSDDRSRHICHGAVVGRHLFQRTRLASPQLALGQRRLLER